MTKPHIVVHFSANTVWIYTAPRKDGGKAWASKTSWQRQWSMADMLGHAKRMTSRWPHYTQEAA